MDWNGDILVAGSSAQGGTGAVIQVDPTNGAQSLVSDHGSFNDPIALAIGSVASTPTPTLTPTITPTTVTVNFALSPGWNLITLPLNTAAYTAESPMTEITAQGGNCSETDHWLNGSWDSHLRGLPFNNFPLQKGTGYFVKCSQSSTWTLQGTTPPQPVQVNLASGWSLVSFPVGTTSYNASTLLTAINAQGSSCSEVDRWLNGGWDSHIGGLPFNNFAIAFDKGYFVKCVSGGTFSP